MYLANVGLYSIDLRNPMSTPVIDAVAIDHSDLYLNLHPRRQARGAWMDIVYDGQITLLKHV